ncbi:MAG: hypothetical protein ACRDTH_19840 [Pseudonocardiaceae bacterium]
MDINEVLLPGVGLRHEFATAAGVQVGIIAERSGDFEFVVYPRLTRMSPNLCCG